MTVDGEATRDDRELFARAVAGNLCAEEIARLADHDIALVARSVGGDTEAFSRLVNRHYETVYRLAYYRSRDRYSADDVAQETFCRALWALKRTPPVFPVGCGSLAAWLGRICCNLCTDEERRRQRRGRMVSLDGIPELAGDEESIEVRVEHRNAIRAVRSALVALPVADREAFCLVYVVGYSRQDVAELLGEPASTVRARVQRARERLATALKDHRP
jgi:RNA polymerase sigma-70 factor (ECF subfamily)